MVFDKNPAEFRGTVDQSPKVHADQLEVGRGLGSCTEFLVGNFLAVRWFLAAVTHSSAWASSHFRIIPSLNVMSYLGPENLSIKSICDLLSAKAMRR